MPTIDQTAIELAEALADEIGPHATPAVRERERDIAIEAAIRMSHRLNKSIPVDAFLERSIEFQAKAIGQAEAHIQVVVLAGYAAFFALWSTMANEIPVLAMLTAGILMTVSVTIYIGWTIVAVVNAKRVIDRTVTVYTDGPVDFVPRQLEAEQQNMAGRRRIMKWWASVVVAAGGTAFFAAVVLATAAFSTVVHRAISEQSKVAPTVALPPPKIDTARPAVAPKQKSPN